MAGYALPGMLANEVMCKRKPPGRTGLGRLAVPQTLSQGSWRGRYVRHSLS